MILQKQFKKNSVSKISFDRLNGFNKGVSILKNLTAIMMPLGVANIDFDEAHFENVSEPKVNETLYAAVKFNVPSRWNCFWGGLKIAGYALSAPIKAFNYLTSDLPAKFKTTKLYNYLTSDLPDQSTKAYNYLTSDLPAQLKSKMKSNVVFDYIRYLKTPRSESNEKQLRNLICVTDALVTDTRKLSEVISRKVAVNDFFFSLDRAEVQNILAEGIHGYRNIRKAASLVEKRPTVLTCKKTKTDFSLEAISVFLNDVKSDDYHEINALNTILKFCPADECSNLDDSKKRVMVRLVNRLSSGFPNLTCPAARNGADRAARATLETIQRRFGNLAKN